MKTCCIYECPYGCMGLCEGNYRYMSEVPGMCRCGDLHFDCGCGEAALGFWDVYLRISGFQMYMPPMMPMKVTTPSCTPVNLLKE